MNEKLWIVKIVLADPPGVSLTVLLANDAARYKDCVMDSVTLPEKLSMLVSDAVDVAMLPWRIVRKLGFVETLKSGPVTLT